MLAGLDARQLAEMYAFAELEPLDEPLQRMLAEQTAVLAQVHGNQLTGKDFMLVQPAAAPVDDTAQRAQAIFDLFSTASRRNEREAGPDV